ncbi:hypothetical protein TNCV_4815771 [Trichonephila clavipes]|nr:hypothetical protein TNCV_4815771 [Trichonephila clavipes]
MNSVKHGWDIQSRRDTGHLPSPQFLQKLKIAHLEEKEDRISQVLINSLMDSIPQMCSMLLSQDSLTTSIPTDPRIAPTRVPRQISRCLPLAEKDHCVLAPSMSLVWRFGVGDYLSTRAVAYLRQRA